MSNVTEVNATNFDSMLAGRAARPRRFLAPWVRPDAACSPPLWMSWPASSRAGSPSSSATSTRTRTWPCASASCPSPPSSC